MDERLCLLTVHAHPDDEASKGAGTVAKYHAAGVHTVLVTCTGGEEGEILNPAMDTAEVRADLAHVRRGELSRAAEIIGYDEVVLLGYRDSGMPGTEANSDPRSFAAHPLEETVERLVAEIRRVRPQVIITYGDDQQHYPHPDHIRVHDISVAAFDAAGDPAAFPSAGEPYRPSKMYYSVWSRARIVATHAKFLELGLESPFDDRWLDRPSEDDKITTSIDLTGFEDIRRLALLAHATQVDPTSKFWFGLPPEVQKTIHPYDDYILARSLVDSALPEDDVFAGVRLAASR
jgi:mycothiol S-conjugate amidase